MPTDRPLTAGGVDDFCVEVRLVDTAAAIMANQISVVTKSLAGTAV
jgi:hypothetical protein